MLTLLNHYWRPDDPVELSEALGRDWADVLEGLPQDVIQKACVRFQQTSRSKPTPAAIYALARDLMPPPAVVFSAPVEAPAKRERVSKEVAAEIVAKAGYRVKKFKGGSTDEK